MLAALGDLAALCGQALEAASVSAADPQLRALLIHRANLQRRTGRREMAPRIASAPAIRRCNWPAAARAVRSRRAVRCCAASWTIRCCVPG